MGQGVEAGEDQRSGGRRRHGRDIQSLEVAARGFAPEGFVVAQVFMGQETVMSAHLSDRALVKRVGPLLGDQPQGGAIIGVDDPVTFGWGFGLRLQI